MARDITDAQYRKSLERNGFKPTGFGGLWAEHRDFPNTMFGTIYNPASGRIARRATLQKLIKDLSRERKRAAAKRA